MNKLIVNTKLSMSIMAIAVTLAGIGCKKYQEGPMVSFRTKTERVANTWVVDNYKKNGNDYTSLYAGYTETFSVDGNYSYSFGPVSGTGTWSFQNDQREIKLVGKNNQDDHTLIILKLEEKQFWYYYNDGNDVFEFHMIQKK